MRLMISVLIASIIVSDTYADNFLKTEKIIWARKAINLHLKTGKERTIIFPARKITVAIDRRIDALVEATPLDGTLYIKAYKQFPVTRIRVTSEDSGQTYLLDLKSSAQGSNNIVEILLPKRTLVSYPADSQPGLVEMSRYAAQQIYAPRRVIRNDSRFREVHVARLKSRRLYRGGDIITVPYRAWRAGNLYVTSIQVSNDSSYSVNLDFRMIRGMGVWKSAVFQHIRVTPKGSRSDQTFMYLVSLRPFNETNYEEALH